MDLRTSYWWPFTCRMDEYSWPLATVSYVHDDSMVPAFVSP